MFHQGWCRYCKEHSMTCAPYPLHGKDIHQLPPASHDAGFQRHTWATSWSRMGFGWQLHSKATVCLAFCGFLATFSNQSFENVCKKSGQLVSGLIHGVILAGWVFGHVWAGSCSLGGQSHCWFTYRYTMSHVLCDVSPMLQPPIMPEMTNTMFAEIRFHNHMDWFVSG